MFSSYLVKSYLFTTLGREANIPRLKAQFLYDKISVSVLGRASVLAASIMAMRSRKSILGLRKLFSNGKEPDVSPVPVKDPVDIPISALRISRFGIVQEMQLTFYRRTDKKFFIGDNWYYVPRCMHSPGSAELDPAIRRFTWVFQKEFASKSTAEKQESFMGAYSIWYKDSRTLANNPKTLAQIDGDFWMMKQVQDEPNHGDTVAWEEMPEDMLKELSDDWWFMGVQLPDINATCEEAAAASSRERRAL